MDDDMWPQYDVGQRESPGDGQTSVIEDESRGDGQTSVIEDEAPVLEVSLCSVCLERYKTPKILSCCHTFCQACLEGLSRATKPVDSASGGGHTLSCPQCKTEHSLPPSGPAGLLDDFIAASTEAEGTLRAEASLCEQCNKEPHETAVAYCTTCRASICSYCQHAHGRIKHFTSHTFYPLCTDQVSSPSRPQTTSSTLYCTQHDGKILEMYCLSCHCLACSKCVVESHQMHRLGLIEDSTCEEVKTTLKELTIRNGEKFKQFKHDLDYMKHVESIVSKRLQRYESAINEAFNAHISVLENRRAEILKEAEDLQVSTRKDVWAQKEYLDVTAARIEGVLNFSERVLTCSDDSKLLGMASQAIRRFQELETLSWDSSEMEVAEKNDIVFTADDMTQSLKTFGQVTVIEEPRELVLTGMPPTLALGEKCILTISVRSTGTDRGVRYTSTSLHATVVNGRRRKRSELSEPKQQLNGTWSLEFAAVCGGKNCITVKAVGQDGSQLHASVSVEVTGMPPIGAKVTRGPDWQYPELEDVSDFGIIRKHCNPSENLRYQRTKTYYLNSLLISWGNNTFSFRWRDSKLYDVQLLMDE